MLQWVTKGVETVGGNECQFQYFHCSISNPVWNINHPLFPFSILYRNEASLADSKSNIVLGEWGNAEEVRGEMCPRYSRRTECLYTFVTHCMFLSSFCIRQDK